jgi:hypothetical protein
MVEEIVAYKISVRDKFTVEHGVYEGGTRANC